MHSESAESSGNYGLAPYGIAVALLIASLWCEREYGSVYRAVPLPAGVKFEHVKATFGDGVLEVSVPLAAKPDAKVRKVEIQDAKAAKAAA